MTLRTLALTITLAAASASVNAATTCIPRGEPFKVVDPQNWVNPDDMTWAEFVPVPNTNWSDPSRKGSERNFNIALLTLDYEDRPFTITQAAGSTIFKNPQPEGADIARDDVPQFYRDLLNKPTELNRGHTLHEYWMEDSEGRFGVDLTVFGVYSMPALAYQYGIDEGINSGGCPSGETCSLDIREDGLGIWREDVGEETADSFELVFILSAGQDESSSWQEFGEMMFNSPEDVPDEFGPPAGNGTNFAATRYVPWSSWAAASTLWPNAGGGSSTQGESSGMAVYAHELSHLLSIGDNYNNPYGVPLSRSYTGPWSMMSRGSFLGPGGPHSRWQIPALQGAALGSLHTVRDKHQLGLISNESMLILSSAELASSGIVTARLTARCVVSDLMGIRIQMGEDKSECGADDGPLCDGGGFDNYELEVVDRMGSDSFQTDSGVMISKTRDQDFAPFQWTIDANPQDIELVDFVRPNGTDAYITLGDYRQLSDALFHAGTRSGSQFEYVDEANALHFYVVNVRRDAEGILSYNVAVRSLAASDNESIYGIDLADGTPITPPNSTDMWCSFELTNNGTYVDGGNHPDDVSPFLGSDIYRLEAEVEGQGWRVAVPNALLNAKAGATVSANVAVGAAEGAAEGAVVTLTATSESDGEVVASKTCRVQK